MHKFRTTLTFFIILNLFIMTPSGWNFFSFNQTEAFHNAEGTYIEDSFVKTNPNARNSAVLNKLTLLGEGEGDAISGNYGATVGGAGDFNDDGFDDIVIGAPFASPPGRLDAGIVYIFYGSSDFAIKDLNAESADVIISGASAYNLFGSALCVPGDINGDFKDDLLIAAPEADSYSGKIYVFYGTTIESEASMTADYADFTIQGNAASEKFGSSMNSLGDVNNDFINDIIVGATGSDRAYILYGPSFGVSDRTILLGPSGSSFGTSVSGGTDLNKDGYPDIVVGAPTGFPDSNYKGQAFIYFGNDNFFSQNYIYQSNNVLLGNSDGDLFGHSLTSSIDVDKDGYYDVLIGAPGDDTAYIYYGKTLIEKYLYPNLWSMPNDPSQPVSFETGVYNDVGSNKDVNTYGLGSGDDGWDWGANRFGSSSGSDLDHIYAPWEQPTAPYADAEGLTIGNASKLEVIVGRTNTGPGPSIGWFITAADSGAWAIEFKITPQMYDNITKGSNIYLELDWEAYDAMKIFGLSGGTEERCYVKLRFSSSTTATYLGTNLGGDSTAELFFWESGNSMNSPFPSSKNHFSEDITNLIEGVGSYYLEMGARMEKTDWFSSKDGNEGIVSFFDNISIYVETLPISYSVKINGVSQSQFGLFVSMLPDINGDGYDEVAVSAPYSNLAGPNSGVIYIINGEPNLRTQMNSNEAQMILMGNSDTENFGKNFVDVGNLNKDGYNEILVGAPGHNGDLGKIYIFTPARPPEIEIIQPKGGSVIEGTIPLISNATDYEDELDQFGVSYYYGLHTGADITEWQLIKQITNPKKKLDDTYQFETSWITTDASDGFYRIKAEVTDNSYLSGEDISEVFEINNPDKPIIRILSPTEEDETYSGIMKIKANCTDADSDLNFTSFYYSSDMLEWTYIGTDYSGEKNIYETDWDTEDVADDSYVILVRANDTRGLFSEEISVKFSIYNPGPPIIEFITPKINDTLKGYTMLKVSVKDKDDNIDSNGVLFSYSKDQTEWKQIAKVPTANSDKSYSFHWSTIGIPDGFYWISAFASDTTNLTDEKIIGPIKIDNPTPPSIEIEAFDTPVSGKIKLKAICSDEDSPISDKGVTFYVSLDNQNWSILGEVKTMTIQLGVVTSKYIYQLEWDTEKDDHPDSSTYFLKARVEDTTFLQNESLVGPFEVNNPDAPIVTLDYPKDGDKLKGTVTIGAYADDPDNDIDERGVSFYFSSNGKEWYFIGNAKSAESNSSLYNVEWDTSKLPNGKYQIKAEAVDGTSLIGESTAKIKLNNYSESGFLNVSSSFMIGSIIFIIIIIILLIILFMIFMKRHKERKKMKEVDERKELARQIREEIMKEQMRMYPAMAEGAKEMPILPPFSHAGSPYQAVAEATASGERRPMLPPSPAPPGTAGTGAALQPEVTQPPTPEDTGPYTDSESVVRFSTPEDQAYQPKVGLTPQDLEEMKKKPGASRPEPQPSEQPQPFIQPQPQPQLQPVPMPQPSSPSPETRPTQPVVKKENSGGGDS